MADSDLTDLLRQEGCCLLSSAMDMAALDLLHAALRPLNSLCEVDSVRHRDGAIYAVRNALDICPEIASAWRSPALVDLVSDTLGAHAGLVRGLYFDKPPGQTWALPWHKDLTIAVQEGRKVAGYSKPRTKAGVWHCEPPIEVLEAMLTLRIHLDNVSEENGPLEVLPGSHRTGTQLLIETFAPRRVLVHAGDVFVMRPLLAHCSGRSTPGSQLHRRVLHLEFCGLRQLPGGHNWHSFRPVTNPSPTHD